MKVLFISSGNFKEGLSPIIHNLAESLRQYQIQVEHFTIRGKGLRSYLTSILKLRYYLNNNTYDIIHAHYSYSSFVASLAMSKPLVVSLMGSDIMSSASRIVMITLFKRFFWRKTIVKSAEMFDRLKRRDVIILPNGVDLDKFYQVDQEHCRCKLGWDLVYKHIVFAANPNRPEKNFSLAQDAIKLCKFSSNLVMHVLKDIPINQMYLYYNASDLLLVTSHYEGSPNVVKEAMACNCPIVSTDVGDIRWLLGDTEGCFLTSFKPEDVSKNIDLALSFSKRTCGRNRILKLGLDSKNIALKHIKIYKTLAIS